MQCHEKDYSFIKKVFGDSNRLDMLAYIMADNFSYTIVYGLDGMDYQTPELIANIYNTLRNYNLEN